MPYVPGTARGILQTGLAPHSVGRILVLTQRDIDQTPTAQAAGFVVVDGAPFSHSLIGLMGMGVPTVILSARQAALLQPGTEVMLDGNRGRITNEIAADLDEVVHTASRTTAHTPLMTSDGVAVQLFASVRSPSLARQALAAGAAAIGLVRSEFVLPSDGRVPDVAFYERAFAELCAAAAPLAVTIRLLDVAADKIPAWMPNRDSVGGALGLQGVRLYGLEPVRSVYRAQLAAISALSDRFDLRLLLPYLVRHEELRHWAADVRPQLANPLPLGAMVETPAGALDLANWFDTADFVAIGCNDLMQCLFAADRDKAELRAYLDPYAPLLFRFFRQIADTARAHLTQLQLCGVLAQLPGVLPVMIGLGYRAFSVEAALIPHLRQLVRATDSRDAEALANRICTAVQSREVLEMLGLEPDAELPFLVS
jgi:phosphoenolpyruvate-protein kinase (PTS system EI component)